MFPLSDHTWFSSFPKALLDFYIIRFISESWDRFLDRVLTKSQKNQPYLVLKMFGSMKGLSGRGMNLTFIIFRLIINPIVVFTLEKKFIIACASFLVWAMTYTLSVWSSSWTRVWKIFDFVLKCVRSKTCGSESNAYKRDTSKYVEKRVEAWMSPCLISISMEIGSKSELFKLTWAFMSLWSSMYCQKELDCQVCWGQATVGSYW